MRWISLEIKISFLEGYANRSSIRFKENLRPNRKNFFIKKLELYKINNF